MSNYYVEKRAIRLAILGHITTITMSAAGVCFALYQGVELQTLEGALFCILLLMAGLILIAESRRMFALLCPEQLESVVILLEKQDHFRL